MEFIDDKVVQNFSFLMENFLLRKIKQKSFDVLNHIKFCKMKKLLTLMAVAGMFTLVSCGPSAEEQAAAEKARQDSIANAEAQMQAAQEEANKQAAEATAATDSAAPAAATTPENTQTSGDNAQH